VLFRSYGLLAASSLMALGAFAWLAAYPSYFAASFDLRMSLQVALGIYALRTPKFKLLRYVGFFVFMDLIDTALSDWFPLIAPLIVAAAIGVVALYYGIRLGGPWKWQPRKFD